MSQERSRNKRAVESGQELSRETILLLSIYNPLQSTLKSNHKFRILFVFFFSILKFSTTMPSRFPGALSQDWEPVVLHKAKPKAQALRDPKAVNQAIRSGAPVQTVKKFDAGLNKKVTAAPVNARKLEEGTEPAALDRVAVEVRQAIQKARLEKKMSQAELAKQINERTQVVQEYENGKAVPNQAVLAKMEKVLGVKLRGRSGK